MGSDIPLGRIAGIKISMNVSVLLVAGLQAWLLATNRFPIESPGHSTNLYWIAGIAGALLFFASLLVHEVGHALVARDEGIGVHGISLWLLGGVAKLESSPTTPGSEFRIAVVGPLASAACGAALLSAAYVIPDQGTLGLVGNLCFYLGTLNLLLAAFNILPAAPLDGGTVLSAFIWWRTKSQATGMRWAARSGVAVGVAMVIYGFRSLQGGDQNGFGIGSLLVGGFIAMNAFRTLQSAPLYQLLDGATVADSMYRDPPTAAAWVSIGDFLRTLPVDTTDQSYPMISEGGKITGLLTAAAIRAVPPDQWSHLRVTDLAFPLNRLTVVSEQDALLTAVQRIDGGEIRTGLVTSADGRIVGTIDAAALFHTAEARKAQLAVS
ncbi:MAG: site-2 protease family protein [Aquihabitans sp.]